MTKNLFISVLCGGLAWLTGCAMMPESGPAVPATPIFFQPFSAALDPPALAAIGAAAKAANADPDAEVTVTGAADSVGTGRANDLLSQTRAQVVADALVTDGVAPSRITVKGIGETATPGSPLPTQFSRRALIRIGP